MMILLLWYNCAMLQTNSTRRLVRGLLFSIAVALTALLVGLPSAMAQDDGAEPTAATVEEAAPAATPESTGAEPGAGVAAASAVSANDVNDVARQLWCPLCSGVRLDACELKACAQMKDVIGQKLAEGEDAGSIKNYFVAQYGPQVLGEPPLEGFNWLAWILPVLAVVAGGFLVWSRVRSGTRRAQTVETAATPSVAAGDPYSRKLEEELKHYD
jgi:cytochrome c-type biogenesis protein CcmH